jgi:hypothetical protein
MARPHQGRRAGELRSLRRCQSHANSDAAAVGQVELRLKRRVPRWPFPRSHDADREKGRRALPFHRLAAAAENAHPPFQRQDAAP